MKENRHVRILAGFTIAYILLALSWWSVLLWQKNRQVHELQLVVHTLREDLGTADPSDRVRIDQRHRRQSRMILGESVFMLLSISIGIWLMLRGFMAEFRIGRQRRNFLFAITHELKTPVAALRLILDTFRRKDLPPAKSGPLLDSAIRETDRLADTLDNLLLTARISHTYQPRPEEAWLDDQVTKWMAGPKRQFPQRILEWELPEEPLPLRLDWAGLEVVVRNLIENAIKYSPEQGKVMLVVRHQDDGLHLEVSDEGSGIPDPEKGRIFDMFYRSGNEDQRETKGTGLGLYLAREITHRNGGTIRVADQRPRGSRFIVHWPVHHEASAGRRR